MSEQGEQIEDSCKDLEEIDFKRLTDDLAALLMAQIGGEFKVRLMKFEHVHADGTDDKRLLLQFSVSDKDWMSRGEWRDFGSVFERNS